MPRGGPGAQARAEIGPEGSVLNAHPIPATYNKSLPRFTAERPAVGVGTLYNSVLVIDETGRLRGIHRKLVPTWAENLTWGHGDGSSLRVHDTKVGPPDHHAAFTAGGRPFRAEHGEPPFDENQIQPVRRRR